MGRISHPGQSFLSGATNWTPRGRHYRNGKLNKRHLLPTIPLTIVPLPIAAQKNKGEADGSNLGDTA